MHAESRRMEGKMARASTNLYDCKLEYSEWPSSAYGWKAREAMSVSLMRV